MTEISGSLRSVLAIVSPLVVAAATAAAAGAPPALVACRELAPLLRQQPTTAEWVEIEDGGVIQRLIEIEGSPVKEGLAVGLVEAPPERVYRVVTDNANFADFMPYVEASTLETLEDGTLVNFQRLDLPWPVSDREYKIALVNTPGAEAGALDDAEAAAEDGADDGTEDDAEAGAEEGEAPMWESAWTHVKGFGNIAESRGAWRIWPCGEASLVEYQVVTDPGGSIPTFLKNTATRRSLERLLSAVRQRVEDPSYDDPG